MRVTDLGPRRVGFVVTNGVSDLLVLDDGDVDEYRRLTSEGWKVVATREICRSQLPKLLHGHQALRDCGAYRYTLVILERPPHPPATPFVTAVHPLTRSP